MLLIIYEPILDTKLDKLTILSKDHTTNVIKTPN